MIEIPVPIVEDQVNVGPRESKFVKDAFHVAFDMPIGEVNQFETNANSNV
jgi:hypothetical protein